MAIEEKLGKSDKYHYVDLNDPLGDSTPVKASLADNLADVYQDMKDFIWLYQKNFLSAKQNAVKTCKDDFETHWGQRIPRIMMVAHYLINDMAPEEDDKENLFFN